jgi:hypothetical protein
LKPRGEAMVQYQFTTHADIFNAHQYECPVLSSLLNYLSGVFLSGCKYRDLGCSDARELIGMEIQESDDYETVMLAYKSGYEGNGNRQHIICQDYFLKNDPSIICYELPVWNNDRSGFIDLIRYKDGKIWILDVKPLAHKEKHQKVLSQLSRYKELLQFQLQIPLDCIECAYFDNANIYQLKKI